MRSLTAPRGTLISPCRSDQVRGSVHTWSGALCKLYPRIANLIAAMWADTEALRAYFEELLADRRRGRKGFPPDVFNDLRVLRDYHAALNPNAMGKWDHERRKK